MKFLFLPSIVLIGFFLPLWVFVCAVALYALFFPTLGLLAIAVCIDAFFGATASSVSYLYTASTGIVLVVVVTLRPYLSIYS